MEDNECPICFDVIDTKINTITTECGHKFHANCLMQNVAHNGFGCPCCRSKMVVDEPYTECSDTSEYSDDSEYSEIDNELYGEYELRGFRLFTNLIHGEENDPVDITDEYTLRFNDDEDDDVKIPTPEYITEKLLEQGVTAYQLVNAIVTFHFKIYDTDIQQDTVNEISDKIQLLIDNFNETVI